MLNVVFHDLCTEYCSTKAWVTIKSTFAFVLEILCLCIFLTWVIILIYNFIYVSILTHLWLICWITWIRLLKFLSIKTYLCHICTLGIEFTFPTMDWIFESEATSAKLTEVSLLPINAKNSWLIGLIFPNFFPTKFRANWLRVKGQASFCSWFCIILSSIPTKIWSFALIWTRAALITLLQILAYGSPRPWVTFFTEKHRTTIFMRFTCLALIEATTCSTFTQLWLALVRALARSSIIEHAPECWYIFAEGLCSLECQLWIFWWIRYNLITLCDPCELSISYIKFTGTFAFRRYQCLTTLFVPVARMRSEYLTWLFSVMYEAKVWSQRQHWIWVFTKYLRAGNFITDPKTDSYGKSVSCFHIWILINLNFCVN